jgi:hypothetical protein
VESKTAQLLEYRNIRVSHFTLIDEHVLRHIGVSNLVEMTKHENESIRSKNSSTHNVTPVMEL